MTMEPTGDSSAKASSLASSQAGQFQAHNGDIGSPHMSRVSHEKCLRATARIPSREHKLVLIFVHGRTGRKLHCQPRQAGRGSLRHRDLFLCGPGTATLGSISNRIASSRRYRCTLLEKITTIDSRSRQAAHPLGINAIIDQRRSESRCLQRQVSY